MRYLLEIEPLEDAEGLTLLLLTVGDQGWPHLAMLSVGELVVVGATSLRVALWPGSTASKNLTPRGCATLALVHDGVSFTCRLSAWSIGTLDMPEAGSLSAFEANVEETRADSAPYAVLESGVRFRLLDRRRTLTRWRAVRSALLQSPKACP